MKIISTLTNKDISKTVRNANQEMERKGVFEDEICRRLSDANDKRMKMQDRSWIYVLSRQTAYYIFRTGRSWIRVRMRNCAQDVRRTVNYMKMSM